MLLAFHNKPTVKRTYLTRVRAHAKADEIIHGTYWENGKGCAVGCTIHGSDHGKYETELGIPRILAKLEDVLFERMNNGHAKEFPLQFLSAIKVGADLSMVWPKFAHWMLLDPEHGVIRFARKEKTKQAIQRVGELYGLKVGGKEPTKQEWKSADAAYADAAAYAADAADAAYAAYAADAADAADAAYAAAAYAAAAYADAAADAADAADAAADAADAAYAADAAAYAAARSQYAYIAGQQLIKFMKESKEAPMGHVLRVDELKQQTRIPRNGLSARPNVYRRSQEARRNTNAYLAEVERKAAGIEEPVPVQMKLRVWYVAAMVLMGVALCVGLLVS